MPSRRQKPTTTTNGPPLDRSDRLLSVRQIALVLGVDPKTIGRWVRAERVPYVRLGSPNGPFRFNLREVKDSLLFVPPKKTEPTK